MPSLDPGPSQLVSAGKVGKRFGHSRDWGWRLLKSWWEEQERGGPPRVLRRGRYYYTTLAVLDIYAPKGRDERLLRKLRELDDGLDRAFARIVELERRLGMRR